MFVDKLKYEELHTLIQSKGFHRKEAGGEAAAGNGEYEDDDVGCPRQYI